MTSEAASANKTHNSTLVERIMHSRAFESVIWSVPLMNYKAIRDGYKEGAGVGYNDVAYHSKVQTWELEIPTGNNSTPYVIAYWTAKDGPVVIEIPASTKDVSLFGALMDSWQRPIAEVGLAGADGGRGAKILIVPPNYQGVLPIGYLVAHQKTYEGYFLLQPGELGGGKAHGICHGLAMNELTRMIGTQQLPAALLIQFNEIAQHVVVLDLQRFQAGFFGIPGLQAGDDLAAFVAKRTVFVKLCIGTGPNETAITRGGRQFLGQAAKCLHDGRLRSASRIVASTRPSI